MRDMYPCDRVGPDFVDTARHRYANSVDLNITPEQLFEVFEDAEAWPRWAKVITHVEWTSPMPPRVGTTRSVTMRGGLVGTEEFLLWEPPARMGFRFNEASEQSIRAFAERYDIVRTATGCRLTWTLALDVAGPGALSLKINGPVMNLTFRWFLRKLRKYTDERYGAVVGR